MAYTWDTFDVESNILLDGFNYLDTINPTYEFQKWDTFITKWDSSWVLEATYDVEYIDYRPHIDSLNQNLLELKIILVVFLVLFMANMFYWLILSFLWKKL